MTLIVGITATRKGLVTRQVEVLEKLYSRFEPDFLVHGDCVGGDEEAHYIFQRLFPKAKIRIRPCDLKDQRAFCIGFTEEFDPVDPLMRNKLIVDDSHIMFGLPGEQDEVTRSGTWSTIRYSKRSGKPTIIIYPKAKKIGVDGDVEEEFNMGKFNGR